MCLGQKHLHKLSHKRRTHTAQFFDQIHFKAISFFSDTNDIFWMGEEKNQPHKVSVKISRVGLPISGSPPWNTFILLQKDSWLQNNIHHLQGHPEEN